MKRALFPRPNGSVHALSALIVLLLLMLFLHLLEKVAIECSVFVVGIEFEHLLVGVDCRLELTEGSCAVVAGQHADVAIQLRHDACQSSRCRGVHISV